MVNKLWRNCVFPWIAQAIQGNTRICAYDDIRIEQQETQRRDANVDKVQNMMCSDRRIQACRKKTWILAWQVDDSLRQCFCTWCVRNSQRNPLPKLAIQLIYPTCPLMIWLLKIVLKRQRFADIWLYYWNAFLQTTFKNVSSNSTII